MVSLQTNNLRDMTSRQQPFLLALVGRNEPSSITKITFLLQVQSQHYVTQDITVVQQSVKADQF